jgi:large subunit ribosomal protein L19
MAEANTTATPVETSTTATTSPSARQFPELHAGYTVRLSLRVSEGKKERIQIYEGIILKITGNSPKTKSITVRKITKGFGVEKIIPLSMVTLEGIQIVKKAKVRQAKLYYVRDPRKKRLKEKMVIKK